MNTCWPRSASYLSVDPDIAGIRALFAYRPETAEPLKALAQALLRGPSPLSEGERELIAAYVSALNGCHFCSSSHGAAAKVLMGDATLVETAMAGDRPVAPTNRRTALFTIASAVQSSGPALTPSIVEAARSFGVSDVEIHDTVLIAAAFSMFNRYVDALRPFVPSIADAYEEMGRRLAHQGYV
jgi:uncharacterized peroxidase-related enzyme